MTTGATRIEVDPPVLRELAGRVESVQGDLASADIVFGDARIGSRRVEQALEDFCADWSQRRGALAELLGAAATMLRVVADHFDQADGELAAVFEPSAGTNR